MRLTPPNFWYKKSVIARFFVIFLSPLSILYYFLSQCRWVFARPQKAPLPVICIGNLVVGGAGKTPTALALAAWLQGKGVRVGFVSRGYKAFLKGSVRVDVTHHTADEVGDEALLLAKTAPTWIGKDRYKAVYLAHQTEELDVLILDDGFQSPYLRKDVSLIVVNETQGFGNGHVLPAGPLREPIFAGCERAEGVVWIGKTPPAALKISKPIVHAEIEVDPDVLEVLNAHPLVAFAGIGMPEKFFDTLRQSGCNVLKTRAFPDHAPYQESDLRGMEKIAEENDGYLVTTEKDAARLPVPWREKVIVLPIKIHFKTLEILEEVLAPVLHRVHSFDEEHKKIA